MGYNKLKNLKGICTDNDLLELIKETYNDIRKNGICIIGKDFWKKGVEEKDIIGGRLGQLLRAKLQKEGGIAIEADTSNIAFTIKLLVEGKIQMVDPHQRIEGEAKECFSNCMELVDDTNSIYTGYGLGEIRDESGQIIPNQYVWTPHAWLVSKRTKEIIETTPTVCKGYFGIHVKADELVDMWRTPIDPINAAAK
jgi:hypothetical protein